MFQPAPAARPVDPAWIGDERRLATVELLIVACHRDPVLAEPALLPQLERERAAFGRRWEIRGRELDQLLRGMKQKLFRYQREGVERFLRVGRLLLADDMGLGKTAQAIASCHALFAAGKVRRAVVVAPAALKPQWAREWRAFTDLELVTVDGHPDERARTTVAAPLVYCWSTTSSCCATWRWFAVTTPIWRPPRPQRLRDSLPRRVHEPNIAEACST